MEVNSMVNGSFEVTIDWNVLNALTALQRPGAPDLRVRLIKIFLTSSPGLMDSVSSAVRDCDGPALMKAAHSLKSSSMNMGAIGFGGICSELEKLGRECAIEQAAIMLPKALEQFAGVMTAFRDYLKKIDANGA
jgi:HPt (histidine-containing phosphotransfer) domain-containing protein